MAKIISRVAPWFPAAKSRFTGGERLGERVRVLAAADTADLRALVARNPVANIFMDAQLECAPSAAPTSSGSMVLGHYDAGELRAAIWVGANLVPIEADAESALEFADAILGLERSFSSIFGSSEAVLALWSRLQDGAQKAFDVRGHQPLMVLDKAPSVLPAPGIRTSTDQDFAAVLPACAAMFEEELGYSPLGVGGSFYRSRVRSLIRQGHSYIDVDAAGRIRFKAELGTVSPRATQIQGVWMNPLYRGQGLAGAAMAAVAGAALSVAPVTSLYVNDYNAAALATYRGVGFEQVGEFATVLF